MAPRTAKDAFTLTELLVTIAIIGILAAILLPAIGKMRAKALRVKCVGNMKQVNLALIGFATDNSDRFPWLLDGGVFQHNGYRSPVPKHKWGETFDDDEHKSHGYCAGGKQQIKYSKFQRSADNALVALTSDYVRVAVPRNWQGRKPPIHEGGLVWEADDPAWQYCYRAGFRWPWTCQVWGIRQIQSELDVTMLVSPCDGDIYRRPESWNKPGLDRPCSTGMGTTFMGMRTPNTSYTICIGSDVQKPNTITLATRNITELSPKGAFVGYDTEQSSARYQMMLDLSTRRGIDRNGRRREHQRTTVDPLSGMNTREVLIMTNLKENQGQIALAGGSVSQVNDAGLQEQSRMHVKSMGGIEKGSSSSALLRP